MKGSLTHPPCLKGRKGNLTHQPRSKEMVPVASPIWPIPKEGRVTLTSALFKRKGSLACPPRSKGRNGNLVCLPRSKGRVASPAHPLQNERRVALSMPCLKGRRGSIARPPHLKRKVLNIFDGRDFTPPSFLSKGRIAPLHCLGGTWGSTSSPFQFERKEGWPHPSTPFERKGKKRFNSFRQMGFHDPILYFESKESLTLPLKVDHIYVLPKMGVSTAERSSLDAQAPILP